MLFKCGHDHAHDANHSPSDASAGHAVKVEKLGVRTVDIHCHLHVPEADALVKDVFDLKNEPLLWFANDETRKFQMAHGQEIMPRATDTALRIAEMDASGVDVQAISTAPNHYCYWAEPDLGRDVAQTVNNKLAATVAEHPDRFVALGTVPLQDPQMAVAELERCVNELGMKGVEVNADVAGQELSKAGLDPFFAKCEELGAVIFIHPSGYAKGDRFADHYFSNIIGNPLATTVAVHYLIFDGVMDRHPGLKVVLAHGGGFLGSYPARIDHAHPLRTDMQRELPAGKVPTDYLKRFFFDSVVFSNEQLEFITKYYGADHVLMGTDYPYDMAETDPVGHVMGSDLTDDQKRAILGENAAKLLNL
ncbi:MAG: amidohydrolase [Alphaproteobacteria bacterium]|jgi:aminocarboxymuconate-semialdehyde decarboxylase|nr:amidohydrolase [Alphaproteobacteria bacterium]